MYYPLLRARQFELIALRELVLENSIQGVVYPILEPVKETHNNLDIAFDIFLNGNQSAYLIINPGNGEMAGDGTHYLEYLTNKSPGTYLPAFRYQIHSVITLSIMLSTKEQSIFIQLKKSSNSTKKKSLYMSAC